MKRWSVTCATLSLILAVFLQSASLWANTAITEYKLSNGLNLVILEDHRAPVAEVQIWYGVGSMDEPLGMTGISHALEHMMFKGPPESASGDYNQLMTELGASGNAFTSTDFTVFYCSIINNRLPAILAIEAERMSNLVVRDQDFAAEHQVILEEWRAYSLDQPEGFARERFETQAYVASGYRHPTIGWPEDVQKLTAEQVRSWHKKWYHPNNATLVIAGDVNTADTRDLVSKYFGAIPEAALPERMTTRELDFPGERQIKLTHPQVSNPDLTLAFNVPVIKPGSDDWEPYALRMLTGILGQGESARLQSELVRQQNIATEIGAYYNPTGRSDSLLFISGTPDPTKPATSEPLFQAIWQQIESLKNTPVSEEEIQRVRSQLIAHDVFRQDYLMTRAFILGEAVALGFPANWRDSYQKKLKSITAEQIQKVAQKYLVAEKLTTGFLEPVTNTGVNKP